VALAFVVQCSRTELDLVTKVNIPTVSIRSIWYF
jgi:hypothetical protein